MDTELPEHALLKKREVLSFTRLGRTALNNAVRRGTFPKPMPVSERYVMWKRAEIVAWLAGDWQPEDELECAG